MRRTSSPDGSVVPSYAAGSAGKYHQQVHLRTARASAVCVLKIAADGGQVLLSCPTLRVWRPTSRRLLGEGRG